MEHFFSPNSSTDLRSDAHQSQIIGWDASEGHTQIGRGGTVKLLGEIYPPGFGTPAGKRSGGKSYLLNNLCVVNRHKESQTINQRIKQNAAWKIVKTLIANLNTIFVRMPGQMRVELK